MNFIAEMQILIRKNKQLEIRLETARKLGQEHKNREIQNGTKCNNYYNQIKRLKEELERLKPKPLLFDTITGFKVIINDSVPEGEIWFATDKQLQMALEFSAKQIEQALICHHVQSAGWQRGKWNYIFITGTITHWKPIILPD